MTEYSSVVFMFKVYNKQLPRHLLCFFKRLYDSHNHNTRKNVNNFKIKYSRTSQKASCVSVLGPKLWNHIHSDLQCSISIPSFKIHYNNVSPNIRTPGLIYHSALSSIVYGFSYLFRHFFVFYLYFERIVTKLLYTCILAACLL